MLVRHHCRARIQAANHRSPMTVSARTWLAGAKYHTDGEGNRIISILIVSLHP
jgi:hypothetical protein